MLGPSMNVDERQRECVRGEEAFVSNWEYDYSNVRPKGWHTTDWKLGKRALECFDLSYHLSHC